jgi:cell wall-associated NlpC family hydrolase
MATYRYPLPRRYRRVRYPYRYPPRFRSRKNSGAALPLVIAGVVLAAGAGAGAKAVVHHAHHASPAPATGNRVAAAVVAFARARVGKVPYVYGGTSDAGMDCSGLAMEAYDAAGITIKRTSQDQWTSERHVPVSQVVPGDLVFFAGSDGTPTAPGHVGIVTGKNTMIDAYAAGTGVRYDTFGPAAAPGTGLGTVTGFTDPAPVQAASPVITAPQAGGSAVATGRRMAASYGWTGTQWTCLDELWTRESGWRMVWNTAGSGAYGIPQALPATKMASAGPDYMTSPATQIRWGLAYIRGRYVTPCAAWAFETSHTPNWY